MTSNWYSARETLIEVAAYGHEYGVLADVSDVLDFMREPWHYTTLYDEYRAFVNADRKADDAVVAGRDR